AVVVAGSVAGGLALAGGAGSPQISASRSATGPGASTGANGSASNVAQGAASGAQVPALGTFVDPAAVASALRERLSGASPSAAASPATTVAGSSFSLGTASPANDAAVRRCRAEAASAAPGGATGTADGKPVFEATLTYRGSPAVVYVFSRAAGRVAVVESLPGCAVLATTPA
ncbi:MAG: hypothetical protein ACRDWW_03285, partial [Acidimicrobiales bacterium]